MSITQIDAEPKFSEKNYISYTDTSDILYLVIVSGEGWGEGWGVGYAKKV